MTDPINVPTGQDSLITMTGATLRRRIALEVEQNTAELRARVAELEKDAARYSYLRDRNHDEVLNGRGPSAGVWCDMENEMGTLVLVTGDDLDAEVDAARKEKP